MDRDRLAQRMYIFSRGREISTLDSALTSRRNIHKTLIWLENLSPEILNTGHRIICWNLIHEQIQKSEFNPNKNDIFILNKELEIKINDHLEGKTS